MHYDWQRRLQNEPRMDGPRSKADMKVSSATKKLHPVKWEQVKTWGERVQL